MVTRVVVLVKTAKKYKVGDKINESVKIDEISMGKMAAYADKAVKSRNDAKAATHSADSNRS
jgi:hypothetical protein